MSHSPSTNRGASDLVVVLGLVGLAGGWLFLSGGIGPVEWMLAVPFLLVLPGYAFVSAILPESPERYPAGKADSEPNGQPGWPVRVALSLAASVLIVGTVGVFLNATGGFGREPAILFVSTITIVFVLIAWLRRLMRAPDQRANALRGNPGRIAGVLGNTPLQRIVMVLALVALVSAVAFAATAPSDSERFTEFYVLAENESGDLVADGFPETVEAGEGAPMHFAIENHEQRPMTYDVIVLAQPGGQGSAGELLDRYEVGVDAGERVIVERTVAPETPAPETRLDILLYKDGVPAEPSRDNADVSLQVWVDVTDGAGP